MEVMLFLNHVTVTNYLNCFLPHLMSQGNLEDHPESVCPKKNTKQKKKHAVT